MSAAFILLLAIVLACPALAEAPPSGRITGKDCIECHDQETPEITSEWRAGPHAAAAVTGCISCHGDRHEDAAAKARRNETCISCHGGPKAPVVRSYLTSKHGVIATIEEDRWDFSAPLADGNYRAPTCSYCHFNDGGHGDDGSETARDTCLDCHSPRFTDTVLEAEDAAVAIGRLKTSEAAAAVDQVRRHLSPEQMAELDQMVEDMRAGPLRYLWHGLVHHSPDYQWWYGQAALDGALLRIKAKLSRILRRRALTGDGPGARGRSVPNPMIE